VWGWTSRDGRKGGHATHTNIHIYSGRKERSRRDVRASKSDLETKKTRGGGVGEEESWVVTSEECERRGRGKY
jgi:hypothetical protein